MYSVKVSTGCRLQRFDFEERFLGAFSNFSKTRTTILNLIFIARVGKTSLTLRFCKGNFDEKQISTVDASMLSQTVSTGGGHKATLNIWDTAGQERYHALNKVYYQGADGKCVIMMKISLYRRSDCV